MVKIIHFVVVGVLVANLAFGDLEDHFKQAQNKGMSHSIENVDFIYMINLDQRPEKWDLSNQQLNPYGVYPYRFSAVNGWELTLEAINDIGLKFAQGMEGGFMGISYHLDGNFKPSHEIIKNIGQTYYCHCTARGTVGIYMSHLSVLQDAYDSGYETIWVMEDDVEVLSDPREISELIEELDVKVGADSWDIFFTDIDIRGNNGKHVPALGMAKRPDFNPKDKSQYYVKKREGENFTKIGARFGAHSMILRRSGVEKILKFVKERSPFLPYDMDYLLPKGIQAYSCQRDIVTNLTKALSDNGGQNYLKKRDLLVD